MKGHITMATITRLFTDGKGNYLKAKDEPGYNKAVKELLDKRYKNNFYFCPRKPTFIANLTDEGFEFLIRAIKILPEDEILNLASSLLNIQNKYAKGFVDFKKVDFGYITIDFHGKGCVIAINKSGESHANCKIELDNDAKLETIISKLARLMDGIVWDHWLVTNKDTDQEVLIWFSNIKDAADADDNQPPLFEPEQDTMANVWDMPMSYTPSVNDECEFADDLKEDFDGYTWHHFFTNLISDKSVSLIACDANGKEISNSKFGFKQRFLLGQKVNSSEFDKYLAENYHVSPLKEESVL